MIQFHFQSRTKQYTTTLGDEVGVDEIVEAFIDFMGAVGMDVSDLQEPEHLN